MDTPTGLVRTDDAAARLGVTIRDIYTRIEAGELEPTLLTIDGKPGRWVHVRLDDLEQSGTTS